MKNTLFKKGLVVGIIVLFISMVFSQSMIAVDLSKQGLVELNNNTSSVSETLNRGYDIAIVDIVPYTRYPYDPYVGFLYFAPVLKNVGNTPYDGWIYYTAVSINLWNNEIEEKLTFGKSGGLQPGEEWFMKYGYGLEFPGPYPPTPFSLQFTATPSDSNPKNNYAEAVYLVWGGFRGPPNYIKIKDITHNIKPRTIDYQFLEHFSLLHRLLDTWRCNLL